MNELMRPSDSLSQRCAHASKKDCKADSLKPLNGSKPVYEANHVSKMSNWKTEQITVLPYLRSYTDEQIRKFLSEPLVIAIPSNSQHVERYIQLNAKNSTRASSSKLRDGLCKATIRKSTKASTT